MRVEPEEDGSEPTWTRWDAAVVSFLVVTSVVLRLPGLDGAITPDELANVMPGRPWMVLTDVEAGVNPPLLRVLLNTPFDGGDVVWWGRRFSLVCSAGAVALLYAVSLRASRWRPAAAAAAALFVVHPIAVRYGVLYRSYAMWTLVWAWHATAMGRALDDGQRRWTLQAVVSAMVLPWVHYLSVPVLLGAGAATALTMPGRRRWAAVYLPAAVGILPMVPYVLYAPQRRVPPDEPVLAVMQKLVGLDLRPPLTLATPVSWVWEATTSAPFFWQAWMALSVVVLLLAHLVVQTTRTQRLCVGATVGLLVGVQVAASIQRVRDPTTVVMLVVAAPALFAVVTATRHRRWTLLAWVLWLTPGLVDRTAWHRSRARAVAMQPFVDAWAQWTPGPIRVFPPWQVHAVHVHLTGREMSRAQDMPGCETQLPCFVQDDVVVEGVATLADGGGGLLVAFDQGEPPDGCTRLWEQEQTRVWRCP
jgi:hypothetical protein